MTAAFVPLAGYTGYPPEISLERATRFHADLGWRRTVRDFDDRPVAREVIEQCVLAAGTAPSGANLQPWHFVVVTSLAVKAQIRAAAEIEEREFYERRAPPEWKEALAPLGTDEHKPFLEQAPVLIAIFERKHALLPSGRRVKSYYVTQSVGIATGLLITAIHHAGLVSLTHTPSPMAFLNELCGVDRDHRPFLLLVVGRPAAGAMVPDIRRKPLGEIATFL